MVFNSLHFAFFLPVVFVVYWFGAKNNLKLQNMVLLLASYYFYACWDWRFLLLLVFSTWLDFFTGFKISQAANVKSKKRWLWLSVAVNLGILGTFKYFNFFAASFADAVSILGFRVNPGTLEVILPIGISFYTFHGLSYVIDLYRNRIKPETDFINYAVFVSFFPLLVAGPIERATHLLPQIIKLRTFDYVKAKDGLRQILWGLLKKIVIADNLAAYVNPLFNDPAAYPGSALVLGAVFFAIQIYCDFSGYADIAIGTARLFGIDLLKNFAFPYFSRDIAEFWRRWHISLSSWFKDYVYIPLGGSRGSTLLTVRNTFIIFLLSGFWHGANWTFIIWGLLHALYIMPSIVLKTNRFHLYVVAKGKLLPDVKDAAAIGFTFGLTVFAWIFFRAANLTEAFRYIESILSPSLFTIPHGLNTRKSIVLITVLFFIMEWTGREQEYAIANMGSSLAKPIRWSLYYAIILIIIYFGGKEQQFIYFQF